MTNDAPLTAAEIAALARADYTYENISRMNWMSTAEWRQIIADLPVDYWAPACRDEVRAKVATLREPELRELLDAVLDTDDPALIVATLRGAAFGLAARVKDEIGKLKGGN